MMMTVLLGRLIMFEVTQTSLTALRHFEFLAGREQRPCPRVCHGGH